MQATNCPRCGRVFTKIRSPICPACEKEDEDTFNRLREYIDENPYCNMAELSEKTQISVKRISGYIREGRLEVSQGMAEAGEIRCNRCGKPIARGRFCEKCAVDLNHSINSMINLEKKQQGTGMHISNRQEK